MGSLRCPFIVSDSLRSDNSNGVNTIRKININFFCCIYIVNNDHAFLWGVVFPHIFINGVCISHIFFQIAMLYTSDLVASDQITLATLSNAPCFIACVARMVENT